MDNTDFTYVYFIGVGGIGMSALARYFNAIGKRVGGYDRTRTELTDELAEEGVELVFDSSVEVLPSTINSYEKSQVLVVYTPAVPSSHEQLMLFQQEGYVVMKRAQVLGLISRERKTIAVAGTHGKTSVSTATAYLMGSDSENCNAFLGGISANYNTNHLLNVQMPWLVAEADEYDRSFLHLTPQIAVITSTDVDHLDIYSGADDILETFNSFARQIVKGGHLIAKKHLPVHQLKAELAQKGVKLYSYSIEEDADFCLKNIVLDQGTYYASVHTPFGVLENVRFGKPGLMNLENVLAAAAACLLAGSKLDRLRQRIGTFKGVRRRFDVLFQQDGIVYIDDYAHHPKELEACFNSARQLYPGKKIAAVFQPHLFSRTRDFSAEFAESLSMVDQLYLLDIYPAREEPIEGVSSELIFNDITIADKQLCSMHEVPRLIGDSDAEVILTVGAGDVTLLSKDICDRLLKRIHA